MVMQLISDAAQLEQLKSTGALLVMFGGKRCAVCQSLKPKIERLMAERFPAVRLAYVDCEANREICAQQGIFSLPVLKLYIEGQPYLEAVGNLTLREFTARIERWHRLWQAAKKS